MKRERKKHRESGMGNFLGISKENLAKSLAGELSDIMERLGLADEDLERMTGICADRIAWIGAGTEQMSWSECLSILFVFWKNEESRRIIEEKGLFPQEMKRAFSTNRNAHGMIRHS